MSLSSRFNSSLHLFRYHTIPRILLRLRFSQCIRKCSAPFNQERHLYSSCRLQNFFCLKCCIITGMKPEIKLQLISWFQESADNSEKLGLSNAFPSCFDFLINFLINWTSPPHSPLTSWNHVCLEEDSISTKILYWSILLGTSMHSPAVVSFVQGIHSHCLWVQN